MDITDHRNQTQQAMAPVCVRGSKAHLASKTFCASIPDKVMHQELVDGFNAGLKPKGSYACIYVQPFVGFVSVLEMALMGWERAIDLIDLISLGCTPATSLLCLRALNFMAS